MDVRDLSLCDIFFAKWKVVDDEWDSCRERCLWCRYLRREKELTEAKHGIIEAEANRLRQQVTLLRRHVESAEQSLAQELEKNAVSRCPPLFFLFLPLS